MNEFVSALRDFSAAEAISTENFIKTKKVAIKEAKKRAKQRGSRNSPLPYSGVFLTLPLDQPNAFHRT